MTTLGRIRGRGALLGGALRPGSAGLGNRAGATAALGRLRAVRGRHGSGGRSGFVGLQPEAAAPGLAAQPAFGMPRGGGVGAPGNGGGAPPARRPGMRRQAAPPPAFGEGAAGPRRDARRAAGEGPPQGGAASERPRVPNSSQGCAGIPYLALSVAQLEVYCCRRQVALGSGFFYKKEDRVSYMTNRHMVVGEHKAQRPDSIRLNLHTDPSCIASSKTVSIDLYDADGRPVWMEHPSRGKSVDVVAIPVSRDQLDGCEVAPLSRGRQVPDEIVLDLGQDLMVVGFPYGLSDSVHNLPIARNASLASCYMVPFNAKPCMLVDSNLHPGTSGSPIFTKPVFSARRPDGSFTNSDRGTTYLVGIHSAGIMQRAGDEAGNGGLLGLNICWFASLLDDMV